MPRRRNDSSDTPPLTMGSSISIPEAVGYLRGWSAMSKSRRRTPPPEGPDRLAMPESEVKRRLSERLTLGKETASARFNDSDDLFAALSKWSTATKTAIDNLFIGSKNLRQFEAAAWLGIGIVYDTEQERMEEALERHQSRIHALEAIIEGLPYMREATPGSVEQFPSWSDRAVTIHMQGGSLNLGTVVGDVTTNVSTITGPNSDRIKELIESLARLVVDSDLDLEVKTEAAESIEVVSEALKQGRMQKASALVRSAVRRIPLLLQSTDQALKVWTELHGLLGPHLPPGIT